MTNLVQIPFRDTSVLALDVDGKPFVVLKPAIEALGLTYAAQYRKLSGRSWACVAQRAMQLPGDTQVRTVTTVDVRTFLMLLATVNENNVAEDKRPLLVAYQSEVADVIEAYWTKGAVINPRATEDQLADVISIARGQMDVLNAAKGLLPIDWLEAKAKIVASRALGETPQIDAEDMPIYVESFLVEQGLTKAQAKAMRGPFGTRAANAYFELHGHRPQKAPAEVNGRPRMVNTYYGRDLPLFRQVWAEHYADAFLDLFGGDAA